MTTPVHRRPYDAFLSHAYADKAFVSRLYELLREKAGLSVWYDALQMSGGDPISTSLQRGIEQCRSILLVGSQAAVDSNWVQTEVEIANVERGDSRDFAIIPVRLAGAGVDRVVKGLSWIDVESSELTGSDAFQILRSFYPGETHQDPATSRDVYVSATWDEESGEEEDGGGERSGKAVCESLAGSGFRLIGDAKDQPDFDLGRIKDIMSSCGAFVGVVPFRGEPEATSTERAYKYFLSEIDLAESLDLPRLVIADPRVTRTDGDDTAWLRMDSGAKACPVDVERRISSLWGHWRKPAKPHFIFYAVDEDSSAAPRRSPVRQLLERVTGMPTITGRDVTEPPLQESIMEKIGEAQLVIADLTDFGDRAGSEDGKPDGFNLNVSIEAGIAYFAGRELKLIARGATRKPPFMLRVNQMLPYRDDAELIAMVHDIARGHRRRVINAEL